MGLEVSIDTTFDDIESVLSIELSGPEMGIIIGKRGQTLDSLQYLTNLAVNRKSTTYIRVKMDTEDYRRRRTATLENLAHNVAYKVKRTRRPAALEAMNPYERRIIHYALQDDDAVVTHSEGEEPYRHVVIALKRK
jgi:spoIIIJ-associated protein